jgi:hypothetical protein
MIYKTGSDMTRAINIKGVPEQERPLSEEYRIS